MDKPPLSAHSADARFAFNVTTRDLKGSDKLEFWRDMARQAVAGCDVSASSSMDFDITARGVIQQGLTFANIDCVAPFDILRDPGRSAHGWDDSVLLFFVKSGRMLVEQDGRSVVVGPGDGVTLVADRPSSVRLEGAHETSSIRLPRILLDHAPRLSTMTARTMSDAQGVGNVLSSFAHSLCGNAHAMEAALVSRLAQSFTNLLDTKYHVLSGDDKKRSRASSKEMTLQRIKAFIDLHLLDPALTVEAILDESGLSRRYLCKLFELEETSPARYIWNQRLDRAAAALGRISFPEPSVKSIAYVHGFRDISHFSSAFRRRFHETPTQYRTRTWSAFGY